VLTTRTREAQLRKISVAQLQELTLAIVDDSPPQTKPAKALWPLLAQPVGTPAISASPAGQGQMRT
jgi:hypothetical protein